MQITPLPNTPLPNALPQDAVAKAVPQVQAQASAPLIQRAIDPSTKSNRGNQTRSNNDRAKGGGKTDTSHNGSVNIRV